MKILWDTFFLVFVDKCFCVCSLLLKSLLWICNWLLTFSLTKTNFSKKKLSDVPFFLQKIDVQFLRNTIFSSCFSFFCDLSWIVVCSVVAMTRTSAAGHPLHQAVPSHFLSFHSLCQCFLFFLFMIMCFSSFSFYVLLFSFFLKKILVCFFFISPKHLFPP